MYQVDQYVCIGGDTKIKDSTVMYLNSSQGFFSASRMNTSVSAYLPTDYFDFEDECLEYNSSTFFSNKCYFLKCYIKRIYNDQIFNIKLREYDNPNPSVNKEQYIKTITIPKWKEEASVSGLSHEWECIELFFNPAKDNFNTIVFELNRDAIEFTGLKTYPKIIYSEIAELKNLSLVADKEIIKFGLQAKPNFLFCLNNEEMRVSSNGIYELRNTAIPIDFLSVPPDNTSTQIEEINHSELQIDNDFRNAYRKWSENKNKEQAIEALSAIQSKVITLDSNFIIF